MVNKFGAATQSSYQSKQIFIHLSQQIAMYLLHPTWGHSRFEAFLSDFLTLKPPKFVGESKRENPFDKNPFWTFGVENRGNFFRADDHDDHDDIELQGLLQGCQHFKLLFLFRFRFNFDCFMGTLLKKAWSSWKVGADILRFGSKTLHNGRSAQY